MPPQEGSDRGNGVTETADGFLRIPGSRAWSDLLGEKEVVGNEGRDAVESHEDRCGTSDRQGIPLALGSEAKVLADFAEGDFALPTFDIGFKDLLWRLLRIG